MTAVVGQVGTQGLDALRLEIEHRRTGSAAGGFQLGDIEQAVGAETAAQLLVENVTAEILFVAGRRAAQQLLDPGLGPALDGRQWRRARDKAGRRELRLQPLEGVAV